MIARLTPHESRWALVLDQSVLDQLEIDPETPLELTTDGQTLIVTPVKDPARKARFEAALEETNRRYGGALKRLAE